MQNSDYDKFCTLWRAAWELRGKVPTAGILELCFEALRDHELSDISAALSRHALDPDVGQYTPKPADVIRFLSGGKEARAISAFTVAMKAAARIGAYQTVVFDDPLIHAVIADMGGWQQFCHTDIGEDAEKMPFLQREFCRRYVGCMMRPATQYPRALTGIIEQHNRTHGYVDRVPAPLLIGDKRRAEQVYLGGADRLRLEHQPMTDIVASAIDRGVSR